MIAMKAKLVNQIDKFFQREKKASEEGLDQS
jgi:hypothetical protein